MIQGKETDTCMYGEYYVQDGDSDVGVIRVIQRAMAR